MVRLFSFASVSLALVCAASAQMAHNYHLEDVNWSISFDEVARSISGDVTNTLTPLQDGTNQIALHEGKLAIQQVTVNGDSASFTVDAPNEQMIVTLPKPANKGDQLKVRISYTGKPQAGVYFVTPDRSERPVTTEMIYTQGEAEDTRYWMPTYDKPDDKATSECYITVPAGYFALSNGALLGVEHKGDSDIYHWKCEQPHSTYLNSFVAGKYVEGKEKWGDLPVNWYVPAGTEAMGAPTFGGTADMVRFYSELTGVKYPYAKFAQSAVADFPFGGMENISAVTQTIDALAPAKEAQYHDIRGLVLHELAHQWFGDLETCKDWSNNWLNEGFATFLPHFYFRFKDGDDEFQIQKLQDMESSIYSMASKPRPMEEKKYNVPMDLFDGHAYSGGSARMFTLMAVLGEKTFWKAIHQFLVDFSYKNTTTDGFFASMSKSTGRDLSWFDKQYFHTAALPSVTAARSGRTVTLTQTTPAFSLDLDVWDLHGNNWIKKKVGLHGAKATFELTSSSDPYVVDPLVNWLADIKYSQQFSVSQIDRLYWHAPNAAAKVRAMELAVPLIANDPHNELKTWVTTLITKETSLPLRRYIAENMPDNYTDLLIRLSRDADKQTQAHAMQKLASTGTGDDLLSRLREVWNGSDGDSLKAFALDGLLRLSYTRQLADQAWNMPSYDDSFRQSDLNYWAKNDADQARDISLSVLSGNYGEDLRLDAIRTLGMVKDKAGEKTAFNALMERLQDPSLHEKMSAVRALMQYGDPSAASALHQFDDFSMYQLRELAKGAEKQLEKK